jgi:broad specificity phosphatase PhoE
LRRAADTAREIAALVPAPLRPDDRLVEMGMGEWEGRTHRAVEARGPGLAAWRQDPVGHAAPGGESMATARRRVRAVLVAIVDTLAGSTDDGAAARPWSIVVAHGGTMRIGLLELLGLPPSQFWSFPFEPCAISVVELDGGRARLCAHNLRSHLSAQDGGPTPDGASVL